MASLYSGPRPVPEAQASTTGGRCRALFWRGDLEILLGFLKKNGELWFFRGFSRFHVSPACRFQSKICWRSLPSVTPTPIWPHSAENPSLIFSAAWSFLPSTRRENTDTHLGSGSLMPGTIILYIYSRYYIINNELLIYIHY